MVHGSSHGFGRHEHLGNENLIFRFPQRKIAVALIERENAVLKHLQSKVTIEIPLGFAVEIATYGESGKISRFAQMSIEKELTRLGYNQELDNAREEKTKKLFNSLNRTLGSDSMNKIENAIKIGTDAIKVSNRMNDNN